MMHRKLRPSNLNSRLDLRPACSTLPDTTDALSPDLALLFLAQHQRLQEGLGRPDVRLERRIYRSCAEKTTDDREQVRRERARSGSDTGVVRDERDQWRHRICVRQEGGGRVKGEVAGNLAHGASLDTVSLRIELTPHLYIQICYDTRRYVYDVRYCCHGLCAASYTTRSFATTCGCTIVVALKAMYKYNCIWRVSSRRCWPTTRSLRKRAACCFLHPESVRPHDLDMPAQNTTLRMLWRDASHWQPH